MELGEKLGEGAGSEAFAYGEGRAIKLFRAETPRALIDYEVRATRAAFEAGAPAPEVFGVEDIGGRFGMVLPRYEGRSLLQMVLQGEINAAEAGAILARVHYGLHAPAYQTTHWSFQEFVSFMAARLRDRLVPLDAVELAEATAQALPRGGALCHGDLHFANIIMTNDGPVIIDWTSAMQASPLADVARQYLTLGVLVLPEGYVRPAREACEAFIRTYAELTATTEGSLVAAIQPYVKVMAVMRMTDSDCDAAEQAMLVDYVRAAP